MRVKERPIKGIDGDNEAIIEGSGWYDKQEGL